MSNIFEEVRRGCARVAEQARLVEVDRARLSDYAAELPDADLRAPVIEPEHHYLGHGDATAAFVLTLDAINFGSGYFPHLQAVEGLRGYFLVANRLTRWFDSHGPPTAAELVAMTPSDCHQIFGQDEDHQARRELMSLFAQALGDLGRWLTSRWSGDFTAPIRRADGSGAALARSLADMPLYRDVASHAGEPVPFYKRAQITVADLWLAFDGEGLGRFGDLDRLTVFADNLVPHVLRIDGVLRYEPELAGRIDAGDELAAGSRAEVEIRACGLHAVELMVGQLERAGRSHSAFELDNYLWHRGQSSRYARKPRHHTRTVYY